jgi:hypothetical protein
MSVFIGSLMVAYKKKINFSPAWLYCSVVCDYTVTKCILINKTSGMNQLKIYRMLTLWNSVRNTFVLADGLSIQTRWGTWWQNTPSAWPSTANGTQTDEVRTEGDNRQRMWNVQLDSVFSFFVGMWNLQNAANPQHKLTLLLVLRQNNTRSTTYIPSTCNFS